MRYWEWVVKSHEKMSKDFPTGEEGFKAVLFLRSFFEHIGCEVIPRDHPFQNRLSVGMEPNYQWLVQYTRKLLTASSIKGFKSVAKRLANPREYLAAHNEIDVALKLYLQKLDVTFSERSSEPKPDLIVDIGRDMIGVEVTSLNPPDEEMRVQMLVSQIITSSFLKEATTGGFVSKVPSSFAKIQEIIDQLNKAIDQAKESRKVEKLNFEGVATIYVAPRDMADQIPEDCRNSYRYVQTHRKPVEEQISKKIREKSKQIFPYSDAGLLFLYTEMIDKQAIFQLFERGMDDVEVVLASYPKLLGLVLTVPHLGIHVVSAVKSDDLRKGFKDSKAFLESEAGVYQYESSIIWKNVHANQIFPEDILHALENYSSNLTNLAPLQESFERFRTDG